jgi:hypothetical protein
MFAFVLSCVGSCLATGWSLVQGVLPTVYMCKIMEPHKEEAKAQYGLQHHIRRRNHESNFKVHMILIILLLLAQQIRVFRRRWSLTLYTDLNHCSCL